MHVPWTWGGTTIFWRLPPTQSFRSKTPCPHHRCLLLLWLTLNPSLMSPPSSTARGNTCLNICRSIYGCTSADFADCCQIGRSGDRWFMLMVDKTTEYVSWYTTKTRSKPLALLKEYLTFTGRKIRYLHMDNVKEIHWENAYFLQRYRYYYSTCHRLQSFHRVPCWIIHRRC